MKKRAIVFVAAGKQQVLPIAIAKKMGFAVAAIDQNPEAAGFAIADEVLNLGTYKAEPIIYELNQLKKSY